MDFDDFADAVGFDQCEVRPGRKSVFFELGDDADSEHDVGTALEAGLGRFDGVNGKPAVPILR